MPMQAKQSQQSLQPSKPPPFFALQAQRESAFFSQPSMSTDAEAASGDSMSDFDHVVQRKCAACETEKKVAPQLEVGPVDDPLEVEADTMADRVVRRQAGGGDAPPDEPPDAQVQAKFHGVQRKCAACDEKRVSPKLEVGPADDPLEVEADVMADRVVRRQSADVQQDETNAWPVQAKADDSGSSETASAGFESSLTHSHGSGAPLAPDTQDRMEEAFGADFSGVRVHTGSTSSAMNDEIGARAFTYGTDIHFNQGEYSPGTESGTRLLAHELTHVVQQNNDVKRAPKRVQALKPRLGPTVFGPSTGMPKGNLIHNLGLLPSFHASGLNPGLWVEPQVPGSNGTRVERGRWGKPDFYRDKAPNGIPIGINEGKISGFTRLGKAIGAPQPPLTSGGPVEDLANAPVHIEMGDVKPGLSGEEEVGHDQLARYSQGIRNTAKAVNDYQIANKHAGRWNPDPGYMHDLDVPDKLARPNTDGVRFGPLAVYEWTGRWNKRSGTKMQGSCVVYKSHVSGIWAYEWMPISVPADTGADTEAKRVADRLESEVKPRLHGAKKVAGKLKRRAALRRKAKKHEKFDEKGWLGAYDPWKKDAEKTLKNSKTQENEAVLDALTGGRKRTKHDPGTPQSVKDRAKDFAQIRHWYRFGGLYGWFRKTFDRVYVKLANFAQSVKQKVKKLAKSAGSSGFGNWIKAAALALFKVAKKLGAWAVSMIVDKLLDSLQEGVSNIVKQMAEAVTPEAVKSKIEEVQELKDKFEKLLQETQENLEKRLFGDKLEMFTKLDKYMEIANTVSTIVSVVRWGIRIVACASPPLLGCLWNLAIAALEYAFSKIMETCWFSSKVFGWVRDTGIDAILNFPTTVAKYIADAANGWIKLPGGLGPLFGEITVNHRDFDIDCSKGGGGGDGEGEGGEGGGPEPTPEQKALMALAKEVGDDKFEAFLEMAAKRAADYNVALDAERIAKLGPLIKSLTVEQMKAIAANQPVDGVPVPVEEFLKSIATLTQKEIERKDARKIDYTKAQNSNPKYEKSEIGWKPELFVQSGVASDSKDFAEAIYDIQVMLGVKADGMAGAYTTKTFYERNRQQKDGAYENAREQVERIEANAADLKRLKEIMAKPYPKVSQLSADLQSIGSNFPESAMIHEIGGRKLLITTTDGGARIGCYYKEFEITRDGKKKTVLIDISEFFTLDAIKSGDKYWGDLTYGKTTQSGQHFEFAAQAFTYAAIRQDVPANTTFAGGNLWKYTAMAPHGAP